MEFKALVNRIRWIVYIVYATATITLLYLVKLRVLVFSEMAAILPVFYTLCLIVFSIIGGIIHFYKNATTAVINILLVVVMTFQIFIYCVKLERQYGLKSNEELRSGQEAAPITDSIPNYSNILEAPGTPKFYTDSIRPTAPYAGGYN